MIGIIGAMDSEVELLKKQLCDAKEIEKNGLIFYKGTIKGKDVVVVKSGIGKVNAALCAQLLIIVFGVKKIINTGIAGATGQDLGIFDFVVSEKVVYHDVNVVAFGYEKGQLPGMNKFFVADETMVEKTLSSFNKSDFSKEHKIVKGLIASGDQFISSKEQKDFIKTEYNPSCVEMEGCAIAHACFLNKIPFVIVRCMSDMADETVESTYTFNEDVCAKMCSNLVLDMIGEL